MSEPGSEQSEELIVECYHCGEVIHIEKEANFKNASDNFWHRDCFAEHCYERRSLVATTEGSFKIQSVTVKTLVDGDQVDVERYWAADCPVCYNRHELDDHSEEGRDELVDLVLDCCDTEWLSPEDWVEGCDVCGTDHRESEGCKPLTYREPFPDPDGHRYDCSECEWSGDGEDFDNHVGNCPECGTAAVRALKLATDGGRDQSTSETDHGGQR